MGGMLTNNSSHEILSNMFHNFTYSTNERKIERERERVIGALEASRQRYNTRHK
jgi:hypothetical protein